MNKPLKDDVRIAINEAKDRIKSKWEEVIVDEKGRGNYKFGSKQWSIFTNDSVLRFSITYPTVSMLKHTFIKMSERHNIERRLWIQEHKMQPDGKRFKFVESQLYKTSQEENRDPNKNWQKNTIMPKQIVCVVILNVPGIKSSKFDEIDIKTKLKETGFAKLNTYLRFITFRYPYFINPKNTETIQDRLEKFLNI